MSEFGDLLKKRRVVAGWRQQDLVDALAGGLARSTLANIEAGRERPSPRFWELLGEHLPEWQTALDAIYQDTVADGPPTHRSSQRSPSLKVPAAAAHEPPVLGGPFAIEQLTLIYTFRHSRAPEEIVELRRVRALRAGADTYGLKLTHSDTPEFTVEEEALFGGAK